MTMEIAKSLNERPAPQGLPAGLGRGMPHARTLPLLILLLVGGTFCVALLSPVQTYDSLSYHLSRVAHWAQNRSVAVYVTGIERQNMMGPFAEYAVLHLYILQGGDRLAGQAVVAGADRDHRLALPLLGLVELGGVLLLQLLLVGDRDRHRLLRLDQLGLHLQQHLAEHLLRVLSLADEVVDVALDECAESRKDSHLVPVVGGHFERR